MLIYFHLKSVPKVYHPPSIIHRLPSIAFHPPFANSVYHPPSAIHRQPFTIHHPLYTIHGLPSTVYHPPSTIHRLAPTVCHSPSNIHHLPFTAYYPPIVQNRPHAVHQSQQKTGNIILKTMTTTFSYTTITTSYQMTPHFCVTARVNYYKINIMYIC